jgi:signal transduction histidine kinase
VAADQDLRRRRFQRADPRLLDGSVALVLLAVMVLSNAGKAPEAGQLGGDPLAYLLSLGLCLPYAVHRRHPMLALAVVSGSLLIFAVRHYAAFPGLSLWVLLFAIALHCSRRTALVALAVSLAVFSVALAIQPPGVATGAQWTSTLLATAVAWLLGENQRNRRARLAALEERATRLERDREERAAQAVAEERLRIARELHDVVAHSMSVIAVQSGVGHHVIDTQPEQARAALAAIETTSRSALAEMRRLLGVLRPDGDAATALTPAPGLSDVPDLVEQVRAGGVRAEVSVRGERRELAPGVDLSAYRIVQEALTNVIKHGGTLADVVLDYGADALVVQVSDRPEPGAARAGSAAAAVSGGIADGGSGHGLIGMRERVAVFGGDFEAGPVPGGGFRVTALLPYDGAAR